MKIIKLAADEVNSYSNDLRRLDQMISYPFGDDFFKIDHGKDYFAFFRRLGEVHSWVAIDNGQVVGIGNGILREVGTPSGPTYLKTWYLCDLKVDPNYRDRLLPMKILQQAVSEGYPICPRAYMIVMNNSNHSPSKMVKFWNRNSVLKFEQSSLLNFYLVDYNQLEEIRNNLEYYFGNFGFCTTASKKELVLESSGKPLNFRHLQHGSETSFEYLEPKKDALHMFSAFEDTGLNKEMKSLGIFPSASASLLSMGMKNCNFEFIRTSDL